MPGKHKLAEQDYQAGMKYKDIAEKHGVTINTVKSWKQRYGWNRSGCAPPEESMHTNKKGAHPEPDIEIKMDDYGLTPKEHIFALHYMKNFNATKAAIAAGYSSKTAYVIGWELLRKPKIQSAVARMKNELTTELGINVQRVILEYMKIAFADMTDYIAFGQREVPVTTKDGVLRDSDGNPVMELVNYIDFRASDEVDGSMISEVRQGREGISIKLHDKMRALEKLERYLDFMTEEEKLRVAKLQAEVKAMEEGGW